MELTSEYHQCQDFSIVKIPKRFKDGQSQQILIFYTQIDLVKYIIVSIDNSNIKLQGVVDIEFCNEQQNCYQYPTQYILVLIMQINYNSVMILVSDILGSIRKNLHTNFEYTYCSFIVAIRLEQLNLQGKNYYQGRGIRSIPNYGNLKNTGNSFYQNGVLMQQFQLQNQNLSDFIVAVYHFNLFDENFLQPILMQGQFNTSISDYAMIIDQQYSI